MDLRLSGCVAVVTGASKGIGLAVTRAFLHEGVRVVAASRRSSPELDQLATADLLHVPVDLTDPAAPGQVVKRAVSEFGGIDILVNNAGGPPPGVAMPRGSFLDSTDDEWQRIIDFNLFTAVRAIRAALPHMLEEGSGSIVNVSSVRARQPSPSSIEYGVAKAGMNNLGKVLSQEYSDRGIRVNTVSPGATRTASWTDQGGVADILAAQTGQDRDTILDRIAPEMVGQSRLVDSQEIADVIAFLASPRSSSTTGAEFIVDSGYVKAPLNTQLAAKAVHLPQPFSSVA